MSGSDKVSKCRSCAAPIIWVEMIKTGRRMPVDYPLTQMVVVDGTRTKGALRSVGKSHFATCPNAGTHRRGNKL